MVKPKLISVVILPGELDERIINDNGLFAEYISAVLEAHGNVNVLVAHAEDISLNPQPQEDAGASSDQDQS